MRRYYMPPEWQTHSRCWMCWPCEESLWPVNIHRIRSAYAAIANIISHFEPVIMMVSPDELHFAQAALSPNIKIFTLPLNDAWMRDSGPTFVIDQDTYTKAGVSWQFNGWGQQFPHDKDRHIARLVSAQAGLVCLTSDIVNEGGAIHVDGEGTCLLTETVQLNDKRNPGKSAGDIEQALAYWLGVKKFIWLPEGLVDDDTHGHIDQLACFIAPGRVIALTTDDKDDGNHGILQRNLEILRNSRDAQGRELEIIEIPQPKAEWLNGNRLAKSYINFYIANGGIVMPGYGESETDLVAYHIIQSCFPEHHVVQVDCCDLVTGGGNIHCITQQEPAL